VPEAVQDKNQSTSGTINANLRVVPAGSPVELSGIHSKLSVNLARGGAGLTIADQR